MGSGKNRKLSSSQIILLGFLGVIVVGTILLMLPWSRSGEGSAPFLDALFTATSAVCVTGLVTNDTATYWSAFGQAVLLCLIQIGGLGVITVAIFITRLSGRKIGLMQRSTMQEAIAAPQMGGIVRLTGFILKMVVIIELLGAAALLPSMIMEFGIGKGIWYAFFHSISSFCNAGFDLMGVKGKYSSLTSYTGNVPVNVVVMLLIVVGGIGFLTWDDIKRNKLHLRRYRMQTKVVLSVTGVLLLLPAVYFYFNEFGSAAWESMSGVERVLAALFQSVTTRTAGYNTVDLTQLTESGQMIMIILMLIGGSPGSTAGGMKVTTFAVLFATAIAVFKRRPNAHICGDCAGLVFKPVPCGWYLYRNGGTHPHHPGAFRSGFCDRNGGCHAGDYAGSVYRVQDRPDYPYVSGTSGRYDDRVCGAFEEAPVCVGVPAGEDHSRVIGEKQVRQIPKSKYFETEVQQEDSHEISFIGRFGTFW